MKRAVIIFPDEWLPYSPTALNLLQCLKERGYSTRVVTVRSTLFRNFEAYEADVASFRVPYLLQRVLSRLRLYRLLKLLLFVAIHGRTIREADLCFGVDRIGFLVGRLLGKQPFYVSLEVVRDGYFRLARRLGIRHVLIQTKERYDWLFGEAPVPYSILPNAPILDGIDAGPAPGPELVYFGYVSAEHGVESCIEALHELPERFRLTIKGPVHDWYRESLQSRYRAFLETGRLTLDSSYLEPEQVIPYLRRFAAGFCFYDADVVARDFNYASCPSGKLFNYLAAGMLVIGSDVLGLQVVREKQCGVLLSEPSPRSIAEAIAVIEQDREGYRQRCLAAGAALDFRTHFDRFWEHVIAG
ncbi:MAG: hypothetical protein QOH21_1141 [Acidobacteriota bacterium]|nr:hypothetical protein [Acidobacteriota bacterium]